MLGLFAIVFVLLKKFSILAVILFIICSMLICIGSR
jgi:hypothetical protein